MMTATAILCLLPLVLDVLEAARKGDRRRHPFDRWFQCQLHRGDVLMAQVGSANEVPSQGHRYSSVSLGRPRRFFAA
jgi:hypothetical protein